MLTFLGIIYFINAFYITWRNKEFEESAPFLLGAWLLTPLSLPLMVWADVFLN